MAIRDRPDGLELHPPEWHFEKIVDFTRKKRAIGEPGSNLTLLGHFCEGHALKERVWRLACYCSVYNIPMAIVLWEKLPRPTEGATQYDAEVWLTEHFKGKGVVTRQERRCVRAPALLARCLYVAYLWIEKEYPVLHNLLPEGETLDPRAHYNEVWESVEKIPYFGRYIAIRFIEGLRRFCEIPARMPDMRNAGGWSPKKALVYLYPQHADVLLNESRAGDALADELVDDLILKFTERGVFIDYYRLASILCDYRGSFEKRHEYPGWDIDVEPEISDKVAAYWGPNVASKPMLEARKRLFMPESLGELSGWHGVRKPLATTLRDHGYNWSDIVYDYSKTKDLAHPVRRS